MFKYLLLSTSLIFMNNAFAVPDACDKNLDTFYVSDIKASMTPIKVEVTKNICISTEKITTFSISNKNWISVVIEKNKDEKPLWYMLTPVKHNTNADIIVVTKGSKRASFFELNYK